MLLVGRLSSRAERLAELLHGWRVNDAALALAMYRQLGMATLARLKGEFARVIWNAETIQLVGLQDLPGG